ncbi:MAG: hypothetical protein K6U03_06215 [Firmicutes bacterium]|nr:hypothetical protein [Bacillota bacterium]
MGRVFRSGRGLGRPDAARGRDRAQGVPPGREVGPRCGSGAVPRIGREGVTLRKEGKETVLVLAR